MPDGLAEQRDALLDQRAPASSSARCSGDEVRVRVGRDQAGGVQVRDQPVAEVVGREHADVRGVDRLGLLQVEPRRVRVDVGDVERGDHLRPS